MEVASATERDVATVHELMVQWEREGTTIGHTAPDEAYLRGFLGECFLVARDAGHHVGFVCARIMDNPGHAAMPTARRLLQVEELFVRPEARQRGIGSALVRAALQWGRERGLVAFHVFTATRDTDRVLRFYRRHGFQPWGIQMYRSEDPDPHTA